MVAWIVPAAIARSAARASRDSTDRRVGGLLVQVVHELRRAQRQARWQSRVLLQSVRLRRTSRRVGGAIDFPSCSLAASGAVQPAGLRRLAGVLVSERAGGSVGVASDCWLYSRRSLLCYAVCAPPFSVPLHGTCCCDGAIASRAVLALVILRFNSPIVRADLPRSRPLLSVHDGPPQQTLVQLRPARIAP